MRFHHHGLALPDPEPALRFYEALDYAAGDPLYDPLQRVHVQMLQHNTHPAVELVWPGEAPSPIDVLLKDGRPAMYHTCYEVPDVREALNQLRTTHTVIPIGKAQPAILFGGRLVWFVHVKGVGLMELLQAA